MRIVRNVHGKTVTQNGINPRFAAHLVIRRKKTALPRPHSEKHAERNTVCVGERIPGAMRHVPFSVMTALLVDVLLIAIVLREGTPSFRTVGNHAGLFWFSMYRFNVSTGAPPAVPA